MSTVKARITALDSLRGIASLIVVISHVMSPLPIFTRWGYPYRLTLHAASGRSVVYTLKWAATYTPLRALWTGHPAVILFFVLSGFVLYLPFDGGNPSYLGYIIKRWFRIYIPYLVSIALGCVLMMRLSTWGIPQLSPWFNMHWRSPLTSEMLRDHVLMLGRYINDINAPIWSLVHEMRISIIFPLLALLVRRVPFPVSLSAAAAAYWLGDNGKIWFPDPEYATWLNTLMYSSFFFLGAFVAKYRKNIVEHGTRMSAVLKAVGLLIALSLYANLFDIRCKTFWADWAPGIGGAGLIALALSAGRFRKTLDHPVFQWLGKISYSLYLVHYLVIQSLMYTLKGVLTFEHISLLALPLSLLCASVFHVLVEAPAMTLGRWLTSTAGLSKALTVKG